MEALNTSGLVIFALLLLSLAVYAFRVKEIYKDVTPGTQRALWGYGVSGVGMAIATMFGLYEPFRFLIMAVGALFLGSIVFAQQWVLFRPERAKIGSVLVVIMVTLVFVDNFVRYYFIPTMSMMLAIIPLTILLMGSIVFSLILIRESPSTFTVSIFAMMLLYMATWVLASTAWTFNNPQFYIFQTIPLVVAAAIFSTVRRPLRTTLSAFLLLLMITVNVPLIHASSLTLEWDIVLYVSAQAFVLVCMIAPLNYFIQQATESGALTPRYLAMVVAFVGVLVTWHSIGWGTFINLGYWNQYLIWVDILLGALAVSAFLLAAVASGFGDWMYATTREFSVIFGTSIGLLGFPVIQQAMMGAFGISEVGTYNNFILLAIVIVVLVGFSVFSRVALRLRRVGASGAAQRLILFLLSAITTAFTTMISDDLYVAGYFWLVLLLLVFAGILALASSPPITARFSRVRRQATSRSTIVVEGEPSIS